MFRQGRAHTPGLISHNTPPAVFERKQRRSSRGALSLSLIANAALLLLMVRNAYQAAPKPAEAAPALADQPGSVRSEAEELLEGLLEDAKGLAAHLSSGGADSDNLQQAAAVEGGGTKYWLTIGIPTVPRTPPNTTYLTTTLQSLLEELPGDSLDLLYGRVRVLVMNNAPGGRHAEFQALRERAQAGHRGDLFAAKAAAYVDFLDNPGTVTDPAPDMPDPDDLNNPGDVPGRQVRKQTCDLVTLLRHANPLSTYYLFMEDDFEVCPYALRALQYALTKANALPHLRGWLALRVSYGMNGVLLRNSDLPALTAFLWEHITLKPPDLLWVEFLARQAQRQDPVQQAQQAQQAQHTSMADAVVAAAARRPIVVYRYNLLSHLGAVSSFDVRMARAAWPGCYAPMTKAWSLQVHERFLTRCRAEDLSPCLLKVQQGTEPPTERWLQLPLDWALATQQGSSPPPRLPLHVIRPA